VCVPAPAADGLNVEPVTPGPEKVPPAVVGVNVTAELVWQYVEFNPVKLESAVDVTTLTFWVVLLVQPLDVMLY
jgi:hypothetical protein